MENQISQRSLSFRPFKFVFVYSKPLKFFQTAFHNRLQEAKIFSSKIAFQILSYLQKKLIPSRPAISIQLIPVKHKSVTLKPSKLLILWHQTF